MRALVWAALKLGETALELLSNVVYVLIESGGFPADMSLIDSIDKLHTGDDIGKLSKST